MLRRYVSLMAGLLQGSNTELQAAAANVLLEVASKRMDPAAKLAMLQVKLCSLPLHASALGIWQIQQRDLQLASHLDVTDV